MTSFIFRSEPFQDNWDNLSRIWEQLFLLCQTRQQQVSPFYHPLFLHSALSLPKNDQPTHIVIGTDGAETIFGLPVRIKKQIFGFKYMEIWREHAYDHISPLDATRGYEASKAFLTEGLKSLKVVIFIGDHLTSKFVEICKTLRFTWSQRDFRCPYLSLPQNEAALLSGMSRSWRRKIRRNIRTAEDKNIKFRVRSASDGETAIIDAFDRLIVMHDKRAEALDRKSGFDTQNTESYYDDLFHNAKRWPDVIHFFELLDGEQVIASMFGYIVNKRLLAFQSGFLTAYEELSPGTVLMYHTMHYLIQQGVNEFDFLRGADHYKFHWTSSWREIMLIVHGKGIIGLLLLHLYRIKRAMNRYGRLNGIYRWVKNED